MSTGGTPSVERLTQFKKAVRQDWTDGAQGWRRWKGKFGAFSGGATQAIIEMAQVRPGLHVLDLASGTGEPSISLAEVVGPAGQITATDLIPSMLAVAQEDAAGRRLTNVVFEVADAENLQFPDAAFDRVTCRFGVMFFPNVDKALREILRVLKPGGRAAFVAWGHPEKNPYFTSTLGVFLRYVQPPPPEPGAPTPFRFAQPGSLSSALSEAGFRNVQEEERQIPLSWPGPPEEASQSAQELAAPVFRRLRGSLSPEKYEQVQAEILDTIRGYYDGQQVNFTATVILAAAER